MHHSQGHVQSHFKQIIEQKYISPSRNVGHRHKNDATLIQQVPGSNASGMQESGHAKKHAETCKHRLHKVSSYDCTAKTSSLFDLCALSDFKRAGTVCGAFPRLRTNTNQQCELPPCPKINDVCSPGKFP